MTTRTFLLLQGVATPFFSELGKGLELVGHKVLKVNFCGGDLFSGRFFSTPFKNINYRGGLKGLDAFYISLFDEHKITDIVLFGDTRPIHTPALDVAQKADINIHVYEEGYFRPNWITLDNSGVNNYSNLSKDPAFYESFTTNSKPKTAKNTGGGLAIRTWHDLRYHAATLLLKSYFPHYKSHRPERAAKEYWGWIRRMPSLFFYYNDKSKQQINTLLTSEKSFYLLPLQLDGDSQMRIHSPIKTVTTLIQTTVESFAKYAPNNSVLVIKVHPLDPWFVNYSKVIEDATLLHGIEKGRIIHLESGDINKLLEHAEGTILVNSTVGTSAIRVGCPVIALGSAIYDMAGLTFQGELDQFWTQASPPNKQLFENFYHAVIEQTQINGGFYNRNGIEMAVQASLPKLVNNPSE